MPVIVWGGSVGHAWKARDVRAAARRFAVRVYSSNVATPAMAVSVPLATAHANDNAVIATRVRKPEWVGVRTRIILRHETELHSPQEPLCSPT